MQALMQVFEAQAPRQPKKQPVNLDPRPELTEDTKLWQEVLSEAKDVHSTDTLHEVSPNHPLYGLLHGLRCGGARLTWTSHGELHLDYRPLLQLGWTEEQLRNEWLMPNVRAISTVFKAVEEFMGGDVDGSRYQAS